MTGFLDKGLTIVHSKDLGVGWLPRGQSHWRPGRCNNSRDTLGVRDRSLKMPLSRSSGTRGHTLTLFRASLKIRTVTEYEADIRT